MFNSKKEHNGKVSAIVAWSEELRNSYKDVIEINSVIGALTNGSLTHLLEEPGREIITVSLTWLEERPSSTDKSVSIKVIEVPDLVIKEDSLVFSARLSDLLANSSGSSEISLENASSLEVNGLSLEQVKSITKFAVFQKKEVVHSLAKVHIAHAVSYLIPVSGTVITEDGMEVPFNLIEQNKE